VIELPRQKHRALLAALLLHGEGVPADRLIEDLWGEEAPSSAKASLQNFVSQLRRTIGNDVLLTRPSGYVLDVAPGDTDLARFEQLTEQASETSGAERVTALRRALALWRGPPLADLAFEPFAPLEIARLEELRSTAEEELVEAELAIGKGPELVGRLERLIAAYPLRERLRGQLMLALYRAGRQAEALEVYQQARRMLKDELGLAPGQALRSLEQAILSQDPALACGASLPATALRGCTNSARSEGRR
jgi:DNA-binding SARP family transcriptional activator